MDQREPVEKTSARTTPVVIEAQTTVSHRPISPVRLMQTPRGTVIGTPRRPPPRPECRRVQQHVLTDAKRYRHRWRGPATLRKRSSIGLDGTAVSLLSTQARVARQRDRAAKSVSFRRTGRSAAFHPVRGAPRAAQRGRWRAQAIRTPRPRMGLHLDFAIEAETASRHRGSRDTAEMGMRRSTKTRTWRPCCAFACRLLLHLRPAARRIEFGLYNHGTGPPWRPRFGLALFEGSTAGRDPPAHYAAAAWRRARSAPTASACCSRRKQGPGEPRGKSATMSAFTIDAASAVVSAGELDVVSQRHRQHHQMSIRSLRIGTVDLRRSPARRHHIGRNGAATHFRWEADARLDKVTAPTPALHGFIVPDGNSTPRRIGERYGPSATRGAPLKRLHHARLTLPRTAAHPEYDCAAAANGARVVNFAKAHFRDVRNCR